MSKPGPKGRGIPNKVFKVDGVELADPVRVLYPYTVFPDKGFLLREIIHFGNPSNPTLLPGPYETDRWLNTVKLLKEKGFLRFNQQTDRYYLSISKEHLDKIMVFSKNLYRKLGV